MTRDVQRGDLIEFRYPYDDGHRSEIWLVLFSDELTFLITVLDYPGIMMKSFYACDEIESKNYGYKVMRGGTKIYETNK